MPPASRPAPVKKLKFADLHLGPLPVDAINRTLGLELEPGEVVFTAGAQWHAAKSHPNEFPRCVPHVGAVVAKPSYVGDDFKNEGKIELVARVPGLGGLLVAICVEVDEDGRYRVASMYPVSEAKIENRRQSRCLQITR